MHFQIQETGLTSLADYASVPCAFEVCSYLEARPVEGGLGGILLQEKEVLQPYVKDYDAYDEGGPQEMPHHFDMRNWGILLAWDEQTPVGGAVIAHNTPGVNFLEGRSDLACLWDIRVHPAYRRQGLGRRLLLAAADWAYRRGCTLLKIETQNVNVSGCRLYASLGCELGVIHRFAYANHPQVAHETMLIWYLHLPATHSPGA